MWPEFLSYFARSTLGGSGSKYICGDGSTTSVGSCDWEDSYAFTGIPGDSDFGGWLALPSVNPSGAIELQGAWNNSYALGEGQIGVDENGAPVRHCPRCG